MKARTTIALIATFFGFIACESQAADWSSDYGIAYRTAQLEKKPLLIVLEKSSEPRARIRQVSTSLVQRDSALLSAYKLCRIDVTTEEGSQIAELFGATEFPQIAITDKQVDQIIFRKTGTFSDLEWASMLVSYKKGKRPL
ncbi:MAG: thioredoxin family protein, partial [Planctomycetales bacterium]